MSELQPIPNQYFFVWFGTAFPYTHYLAIKSVATFCRPDAIYLFLSDSMAEQPYFRRLLAEVQGLCVETIDIDSLIEETGHPAGDEIRKIHAYLLENGYWGPLSDVLRYLLLYSRGGVYLDMDILVVRDLRPLLNQSGFCGREHILVSGKVAAGPSRLRYFRTAPLTMMRALFARCEDGVRYFEAISHFFIAAINGAVLGMAKDHPMLSEALDRLPKLGYQCPRRREIIGPDLLQDMLADNDRGDVTVYPPAYFYPLGPTMARHYFRPSKDLVALESRVISTNTYAIHWYYDGTNSGYPPENERELSALSETQLFSRLAADFLSLK